MIVCGVDPGANGGIVALDRAGKIVCASRCLQTASDGGVASRPSAAFGFWERLRVESDQGDRVAGACVEEPICFVGGKAAPKSIVAVALSAGAWLSLIAERTGCQRIYLVPPRTWQSAVLGKFGSGESKARAEMFARGVWGDEPRLKHTRGFHDGLVDAACIAQYCLGRSRLEGWA